MAAGFTYFDTAWAYPGSEDAIRQALVERYPRESFQLATKNAAWLGCKTREEAVAQFETSLRQTGAGYFDFYLLHNLGEHRTHFFDDFGLWNFVQEKKRAGLIRHVGFSFHSTPRGAGRAPHRTRRRSSCSCRSTMPTGRIPAVQSRACYEVARRHGKPVIIMEPVKGGLLANPPESVAEIFKAAEPDSSCASWAVRFAASLDGVLTVLSGMSSTEQMEDNLRYMKDFSGLTPAQQNVIRPGAEGAGRHSADPLHQLQLLRQGLPEKHRDFRNLYRDEQPHALS
jgi:predicted aldo/keto reductase-like oxidoreductase